MVIDLDLYQAQQAEEKSEDYVITVASNDPMAPFVQEVSKHFILVFITFLYQVEEISKFIDGMDEDVKEVDKIHSHILSSPKPDESK